MPVGSPEERTVEVLALPESLDEELLGLYFENKRSGGGPLVSVEKTGDRAVLVFEDAAVASQVLKKRHVLHSFELTVRKAAQKDPCRLLLRGINPGTVDDMIELYVENMMGLDEGDYALCPSPGRDLILIHLSEPLSKDFQDLSARISNKQLDGASVTLEQIDQTDSVLVENLQPGTSPDTLTLYFESDRGGSQAVREVTVLSEDTAKVSFLSHESVDRVLNLDHNLNSAALNVKPYFDFLQPNASQTGSEDTAETNAEATSDNQMQISSPTAAAANSPSSSPTALQPPAASEAVKEADVEIMEHQTLDTVTLLSDIVVCDPVKMALFKLGPLMQNIEETHPNVIVEIRDDGVHLEGTDSQKLEHVKHTISDFIGNMAEVHFTLEPETARFLARKDVKERLLQEMNQAGSPSMYSVSDAEVVVTSLSQNSAKQACSFLKSHVCVISIPVDEEHVGILYCREWSEFLQALGFASVKVSERGGNIDLVTLKGMEREKQSAILHFLSTPIERDTVMSMEPGMLKYIQVHCHQLLADMDQVSIFPLEAVHHCGLKIHGNAVACQMAEEVLQGVVSSICTRTITVNSPGMARFLAEAECRSILNEMESKFQVIINTTFTPWNPLPHENIFETAWELMCHNNFQNASAAPDSLSSVFNGSQNKRLLDEAKKIVSSIDHGLGVGGGTLDQLDIDNVDLYTAEEPTSPVDNDASVQPSPLSAEGSATGGLILNDETQCISNMLEEEAQLSLAIQYSMESSCSNQEEEQLKRALELSKTIVQGSSRIPKQAKHPHASLEDAIKAANTIQLDVFAGYSCDLIRVDIAFGKKVSQRRIEEKLEHSSVKNMSEYHKKCLELIKRKHAVDIQVQGTVIAVSGFKDYVSGGMSDVKLLVGKMSTSVSDRDILKAVRWVRHDPASSDTLPYAADLTVFIENAWRMKVNKVDILLDNQLHRINFERMQEYNVASGKSVTISRKLLELEDLDEDMAEEEISLLSNLPDAARVDEESDEFQDVVKSFYETIQEYHSKIRIIQVEKLTNRLLYNQYKLKKASVLQRATYPQIERTLYHGTSETSVKEICVHGFNRSFCGKNATVYGQGVYFAVNSALSVQDQYSPPNADGYKFVFVSKVLTGDFTIGCHSMKTAPLKETGDVPLRYDSVTDNITKPSMFVIFNDTQAFPEYLITCQKIIR